MSFRALHPPRAIVIGLVSMSVLTPQEVEICPDSGPALDARVDTVYSAFTAYNDRIAGCSCRVGQPYQGELA